MAEVERQSKVLRFEEFEVDVRTGELRRAGVKLRFGGQPFQVLSILLERPGDVVTRAELQKRLWPDTFVDVDHNLNTAINKIREVLGDSAESPRFVETLSRRGYRFIGELDPPVQAVVAIEPKPIRGSHSHSTWPKIGVAWFAISVVVLGTVAAYRWSRQQPSPPEKAVMAALPFTALPGIETAPAFSPDGSRIAFAWDGDPASGTNGFDLYEKGLGSETTLRLTQHPSQFISTAWSPDGTQIAFHRLAGADSGIYIVSALGGPERKLRSSRVPWCNFALISWSPDGKWIAFSDLLPTEEHAMIYLLSTETLETRQIPNDPKCLGQGQPAFSHSGQYLAFWCFRSPNESNLYSLTLAQGKFNAMPAVLGFPFGLAWSADDKQLIFAQSYSDQPNELGEVAVANGAVKRLGFASSVGLPTVSSRGDKLAFSSDSSSLNIWRRDLLHLEAPAVELLPSTRRQDSAQYSPDGKRIAFASDRAGGPGVWVSDEVGSNLVQISNRHQTSGNPQWSPDGKKIAFDSRPLDRREIYVADVAEGNPRKLVTNLSNVMSPHWSRDGKWIYFRSFETGKTGVYRCPALGGDAIALVKDVDAFVPQESYDGKTVFYSSHGLKRLALPPQLGTDSEVEGLPRLNLWTLSTEGIYFVPASSPRSLRYFDFATKQIRSLLEVDKDFGRGLSVSPDGRWLLYSQIGDVNADIMLVDRFH